MKLKRFFSGIIAAAIFAGYIFDPQGIFLMENFSFTAYAEDEKEFVSGDYKYTVKDGGAVVTEYTGKDKYVAVPDKLDGNPVTVIGDRSFYNARIKRISIPKTVKSIGYMAFCICYWLEEITLSDSIESVSFKAFSGCVGLKRINISSGTGMIDDGAFFMCPNVEKITVGKNSKNYKLKDGVLYSYDGKRLIMCPPSLGLTSFKMPNGVTTLDCCAFFCCNKLKKITLPKSLKYISGFVFTNCASLIEVTIPSNTSTIATNAFEGCLKLKKIVIPGSVNNMSNYIFDHCPNVTIYGAEDSYAQSWAEKNDIPFRVLEGMVIIPDTVRYVTAEMSSSGKALVSWFSADKADGYSVYMSDSENGTYKKVKNVNGGETVQTEIKRLDPDKEYWFKVRAYRDNGGNKVYGNASEAVKTSPDSLTLIQKNAPIYYNFIKRQFTEPLYISVKLSTTDTPQKTEYSFTVAISGDKLYIDMEISAKERLIIIVSGKDVYFLDPLSKSVVHSDSGETMFGSKENILNSLGTLFYFDLKNAGFESGKKTYNGKAYYYETIRENNSLIGREITILADMSKKVRYILKKDGSETSVCEIIEMNNEPKNSLFEVPEDYTIVSEEGFFEIYASERST